MDPADDWVLLTSAADEVEAQLITGLMQEVGVPVRAVKDRSGFGDYLFGGSNPRAPVALHVPAERLDEGRAALAEVAPEKVPGDHIGLDPLAAPGGPGTGRRVAMWLIALLILAAIVLGYLGNDLGLFN